jgi:hypothetical protein
MSAFVTRLLKNGDVSARNVAISFHLRFLHSPVSLPSPKMMKFGTLVAAASSAAAVNVAVYSTTDCTGTPVDNLLMKNGQCTTIRGMYGAAMQK